MQLLALALIAWTHAGWPLFLRVLAPSVRRRGLTPSVHDVPSVVVIVAAYAEERVIAGTVSALRASAYAGRVTVVVACDGSPDGTAAAARSAGADLVLELPRGGKHAAQAAAVAATESDLVAFADANTTWAPDALRELVGAFDDPEVGYACGHVTFVRRDADGAALPNEEGAYWRLELSTRERESAWWSVTAGNGAIYALRRELWAQLRTDLGHDLALPHQVVRARRRAVDVPAARAEELMVPTLEGEWRRKRRMMARAWRIVLRDPARGGLLDPRGLPPRYLLALASHRWLRYASPLLHVVALAAGARTLRTSGTSTAHRAVNVPKVRSRADRAALAAQVALLAGAAAAGRVRSRPLALCRYYVLMTASIAAGGIDALRRETPAGWTPPEGTR